jgi:lysophospholipase L1-like esterase
MGGEGSMVKWVKEEKPPLANKDYTHFSAKGSKKVASLIYNEIEGGYTKYIKLKVTGKIE